jgi:hypothetical protein
LRFLRFARSALVERFDTLSIFSLAMKYRPAIDVMPLRYPRQRDGNGSARAYTGRRDGLMTV